MHRVDGRNYFGFVLQSALVSHRVDGVNYSGFVQQSAMGFPFITLYIFNKIYKGMVLIHFCHALQSALVWHRVDIIIYFGFVQQIFTVPSPRDM